MKDDFVYGKPKLDLYYLGIKSEHKDVEFDGTKKPFQLIKWFTHFLYTNFQFLRNYAFYNILI